MADDRMAVLETVRKAISEGDADSLREGVRVLARAVMEAEVTELTGAPRGGRNPEARLTHRNGCRERRRDTRAGTIGPAVPRVRDGSCLPSLLEPRRRVEPALLAVVSEAHVAGVSTRRVEDPVEALGIASMSRSEVSRICAALDDGVEASRTRPLDAGAGHPVEQLAEVVAVLAAGPVGHDRRRGARKSSNRSARSRDASHRGAGGRSGEWWAAMGGSSPARAAGPLAAARARRLRDRQRPETVGRMSPHAQRTPGQNVSGGVLGPNRAFQATPIHESSEDLCRRGKWSGRRDSNPRHSAWEVLTSPAVCSVLGR